MPASRMKFSEFVDVLLVRLYEADEQSPGRFFDLNALAKSVKTEVPLDWVFDAAKVLESRVLAQCLYTFGATQARLTGEGRLYVEEGRGTTKRVVEHPDQYFINVSGPNSQVVVGNKESTVTLTARTDIEIQREPAFRELDGIREALTSDITLSAADKEEAQTLLKVVEIELRKPSPRRQLLGTMLDALSKITSIATGVATLTRLLTG